MDINKKISKIFVLFMTEQNEQVEKVQDEPQPQTPGTKLDETELQIEDTILDETKFEIPDLMFSEYGNYKCVSNVISEEFDLLMRKKSIWDKFLPPAAIENAVSSNKFTISLKSPDDLKDLNLICSRFDSLKTLKGSLKLTLDEIFMYYIEEYNGKTYIMEICAVSSFWTQMWPFKNYLSIQCLESHLLLAGGWNWLLELPHHRFWSQIIYDEDTKMSLVTFLERHKLFKYYYTSEHFYHLIDGHVHHIMKLIFLRLFQERYTNHNEAQYICYHKLLKSTPFCDVSAIVPICELFDNSSQWKAAVFLTSFCNEEEINNELAQLCVQFKYHLDKAGEYIDMLAKNNEQFDNPRLFLCIMFSYIETSFVVRKIATVHQSLISILRYMNVPLTLTRLFSSQYLNSLYLIQNFCGSHTSIDFASIWSIVQKIRKEIVFFLKLFIENIFVELTLITDSTKKEENKKELYRIYESLIKDPQLMSHFFQYFTIHKDVARLEKLFEDFTCEEQSILSELVFKYLYFENEKNMMQNSKENNDFDGNPNMSDLGSKKGHISKFKLFVETVDKDLKKYHDPLNLQKGQKLVTSLLNMGSTVEELPLQHLKDYTMEMLSIATEELNIAQEEMENPPPSIQKYFDDMLCEHHKDTQMKYIKIMQNLSDNETKESENDFETFVNDLENTRLKNLEIPPKLSEEEIEAIERRKIEVDNIIEEYKNVFNNSILKSVLSNNRKYMEQLMKSENPSEQEEVLTYPQSILFQKQDDSVNDEILSLIPTAAEVSKIYASLYPTGVLTEDSPFYFKMYRNIFGMVQDMKRENAHKSKCSLSLKKENGDFIFSLKSSMEENQMKHHSVPETANALMEPELGEATALNPRKTHTDLQPVGSDDTLTNQAILESLIIEIKSIFPDFGEGFIEKCLQRYDMNSQQVINAILEDNLPTDLNTMDRSTPIIPPEPIEEIKPQRPVYVKFERIDSLLEVDEDEETIESVQIFRKKNKFNSDSLRSFLNDKSHIDKKSYEQYQCPVYEDDYDEEEWIEPRVIKGLAYDGREDVVIEHRPGASRLDVLKKQMQELEVKEEEESEEDEEDIKEKFDKSKSFCQDPAILRQKAEERRKAKQIVKRRNVVGNPKGQGQEKDVLRDRSKKNQHKATAGNHNRRTGARFKRNQGMIPS